MMSDKELSERYLVLEVEVGSTAHGTGISGEEDVDLLGVCMEPPECVYGLRRFTHYEFRARPQGERGRPGDIEGKRYSLRRFADLAIRGNPSVLVPLFAHPKLVHHVKSTGDLLRNQRKMFLSKAVGYATLGYLKAQYLALVKNNGQGHNVKRPELIEKYGYDAKFAGHAVRLALQGIELMTTGWMSVPMQEEHRQEVLAVRTGQVTFEQVCARITELDIALKRAVVDSVLPDEPDFAAVNQFLVKQYSWLYAKRYE